MDSTGHKPDMPQPLEYASARRRDHRVANRLAIAAIGLVVIFLAFSLVLPLLNTRLPMPPRTMCASNLRQIGQAAQMYANDHAGKLPDDFATLLDSEDLSPGVFVCPETSATPPAGPTTQAVIAAMKKPGAVSYIYLGKGLTIADLNQNPDIVLAYEPPSNHGGAGRNVLFGDGHVEWIQGKGAQSISSQATSGQHPVKLPQLR